MFGRTSVDSMDIRRRNATATDVRLLDQAVGHPDFSAVEPLPVVPVAGTTDPLGVWPTSRSA